VVPILLLLAMLVALTVKAGPALAFMEAAVSSASRPAAYLDKVMEEDPLPLWRDENPQKVGN
jgi:multicomponent K+:H+ antiporter subunit D